ncbi:MAG: DUF2807 domain-containing protein [Coxiellaceae bacterium]|nr:DUF2807 domain-containing protein [Coxiellaceae bacterium]
MKIWQKITFIFAAAILMVSCSSDNVSGNGKSVTKSRQVASFTKVQVSGAYRIVIHQASASSVKITTDSNIEPLVVTNVKGDTLRIHNKKGVGFSLNRPVLVELSVKELKQLSLSGANEIVATGLNDDKLDMNTNGSAQGSVAGKIDKFKLQVSGSATIDASQLVSKKVSVRLTGSGQVKVNATDSLESHITGSGTVIYSGDPSDVNQTIVGSGKLERVK